MGAPGFDDAPVVTIRTGVLSRRVQFVYPYYENPEFFSRQLSLWSGYPEDVRERLSVIVVDDGSPRHPAIDVVRSKRAYSFALRVFRIIKDVRWNWLAARNIGMRHAIDGWCVLTDMDHVVPYDTLRSLVYGIYEPAVIYTFSRRESSGAAIHTHPNSMFMTRDMFWRVGGYDEALSGHYGTDGDWRRRCASTAKVLRMSDQLIRHEYDGDSSTRDYLRKQPEDAGKKAIIASRGRDWKPKVLSFEYREELP